MKASWIFLAMLLAASSASAQMYKWIDKDGKVRYGDAPPPGAKASSVKAPASGAAPAPSPASAAGDAKKKGPLTAAEQEQEFRRRRQEDEKAGKKSDQEQQAKSAKSENCMRAQEYLVTLKSGQRISRTATSGERYYMDENQVAQELAKTEQTIKQVCTN